MSEDKHVWHTIVDTKEKAEYVKHLRCEVGCTWRSVAQHCNDKWQGDWNSNQIAGMYFCEDAADLLGEDAGREPWN